MSEEPRQNSFRFLSWRIRTLQLEADAREATGSLQAELKVQMEQQRLPASEGTQERLEVTLKLDVEFPGDPPAARVHLVAVGLFEVPEAMDEHSFAAVARFQAPALVYTQLRPTVRILLAEAGIPGFLLPALNFRALVEGAQSEASAPVAESPPARER